MDKRDSGFNFKQPAFQELCLFVSVCNESLLLYVCVCVCAREVGSSN